jgi:transposase-like protein
MARAENGRKWREGTDATLTRMCESGEYSVRDIAREIGVTVQTVYPQMRRLGLPLLGEPGCRLRDYRSHGSRYNEIVFSEEQIALVKRRNAERWYDSRIARELGVPENTVRKLRSKLGLRANIRKPVVVGTRYGNLVVLKTVSPKNRKRAAPNWVSSRSLCSCDCGRTRVVFDEDIRSGRTKTCGCRMDLRNLDSEWVRVFHCYAGAAKMRAVKFNLSLEQVKHICSLPCHYCGARESNIAVPPRTGHRSRKPLSYNGIDQVIPCGGYRLGNVLPCCYFCNRAKSNLPLEIFVPWVNRIFGRHLTTSSVKGAAAALAKN